MIRSGDIIGVSGGGWSGFGINLGSTGWPFPRPVGWRGLSHVAIVAPLKNHGQVLWESTTFCDTPCLIRRQVVAGVQAHWIDDRIREYHDCGGVVWHYPLRRPLALDLVTRLGDFLWTWRLLDYDYLGAFDARSTLIARLYRKIFSRENLRQMFCSELCGAAHKRIGLWNPKNVSGFSPNSLTRAEIKAGVLAYPGRVYP